MQASVFRRVRSSYEKSILASKKRLLPIMPLDRKAYVTKTRFVVKLLWDNSLTRDRTRINFAMIIARESISIFFLLPRVAPFTLFTLFGTNAELPRNAITECGSLGGGKRKRNDRVTLLEKTMFKSRVLFHACVRYCLIKE